MIRVLFLLLMFFSSSLLALASTPLPEEKLNPVLAQKLGFKLSFEIFPSQMSVFIDIPEVIDVDCHYRLARTRLLNMKGELITTTLFHVAAFSNDPTLSAMLIGQSNSLSVSFEYLCQPDSGKQSRVYVVDSVSQYLASSLSKSHNKPLN